MQRALWSIKLRYLNSMYWLIVQEIGDTKAEVNSSLSQIPP